MEVPMPVVYQAVNLINGKRYIGITSRTLLTRATEHLSDAKCRKNPAVAFHRAIRKYGADLFRFSVLASVDSFEDACRIEVRLIAAWHPEYNSSKGGDGNVGLTHTAEARARIAAAARLREPSFLGRSHTDKTKRLISEKNSGRPMLEHTRQAMKAGREAYLRTNVMRAVRCSTDGRVFPSATEAARAFGWKDYVIANAVGKTGGRCRGLHFEYLGAADGGGG
jgi:group I intron endonuclease